MQLLSPKSRNKRRRDRIDRALASKREKNMKIRLQGEAERARFEARFKGEIPKVYVGYGISEADPFTNEHFTWDLWLKFPFKVPKEKCERFKEAIQIAFEKVFLA